MDASSLLEPIISQNDFILSLWQTFMTAHFAIVAGLLTHRKPIPHSLGLVLFFAYLAGLYINGNSLIDAYGQLGALQRDFIAAVPSENPMNYLISTKKYLQNFLDYPNNRANKVWAIYGIAAFCTTAGFVAHRLYHSNYFQKLDVKYGFLKRIIKFICGS